MKYFPAFCIMVAILVGFFVARNEMNPNNEEVLGVTTNRTLKVGNKILNIEIANTNTKRARGLSGRDGLKEDEAMLFIFEEEDVYGFWMKEMKFSIDIAWLDKNKKIIHIEKNISPETYPAHFTPETKALYVLETNSGFFEKNQIEVGQSVEF